MPDFIRPDPGPRSGKWHKRIVSAIPVKETNSGHWCELECGHQVMTFGDLRILNGVALCEKCMREELAWTIRKK